MEEKQAALEVKLSGLEKSPAGEPEVEATMEESSDPPAAAPAEEAAAPEVTAAEAPADITEKVADPVPATEPEEPKGKTILT